MKTQISKWLIVIATFVSLMFVVTGLEAGKPDPDNPNKPPKSDNPKKTKAECILFTGDLLGMAEVEGCCPNAGPFPAYTMTLDLHDKDGKDLNDVYGHPYGETAFDGQLFMNGSGSGPNPGYKVQFWSWDVDTETPGNGDIFFEIDGGDIFFYDRKNKYLNVTFTDAQPALWLYDDNWDPDADEGAGCCAIVAPVGPVSFDLIRTSDLSNCGE
jgi:hypothetical protein